MKGGYLMEKNYELLYHYASLDADSTLTIRLPHELRDDFASICPDGNVSKALREFMVHEVATKCTVLPQSDGTRKISLKNLVERNQ